MHRQAYGVLLVKMAESGATTLDRAEQMLESALSLDASLAEAQYQLGGLELARGNAAGALARLEAAARLGLDDSRLHYATARALRRLARNEESEKQMGLFRARKKAEEIPGAQP